MAPRWPLDRTYRRPDIGWAPGPWGHRTLIMAVINTSPDSFSGDGITDDPARVLDYAQQLIERGADIIDIGGESTRPGAAPVAPDEQIRRAVPTIEILAGSVDVALSIDTTSSQVAAAALSAGASIVNDTSGTLDDPDIAAVAASHHATFVTMHNQRRVPTTRPESNDVIDLIVSGLSVGLTRLDDAGVDDVIIDPGFGFGWTLEQNLEVLRRLPELHVLGLPILIGTSRKGSVGKILHDRSVNDRLWGTAATVAQSITAGTDIVRVHDVAAMADVVRVTDAIVRRSTAR